MKWVPCAFVLAFLAGAAVSGVAWADRAHAGPQIQVRHDASQARHFQPRREAFQPRHVASRRDGVQSHRFQSRRDGFQSHRFQSRGDDFGRRHFQSRRDIGHPRHFRSRPDVTVIRHHGIRAPRHDRFAGHRVHRRARIGVFIGAPLIWHWPAPYSAYPAYPAYPPVVAVPTPPPVYIERGDTGYGAPGDPRYWYYCQDPAGYYPYVNACPGGWQRVEPTPPDLGER